MRTVTIFILLCIVSASSFSQAWVWEKPINTTNNSVVTDPNNNIIVLSRSGTATLISKFTKDGLPIWSKRLTKATAFTPSGSVVVDKSGNIYTYTEGFDSVNSQFTGIRLKGVTKFNPQGNIVWHADFYGTHSYFSATENRLPIQIDENNNIYVSYYVQGFFMPFNIQLGGSSFPFNSFSSYYAYLATGSITASGVPRWANTYSFNNSAFGGVGFANSITVSGNKLFIGGFLGKAKLYLDNSVILNADRCTAWLAAIDGGTGLTLWHKLHDLFYFCAGSICGCSYPSLNANTATGKVVLTDNLNGAFVFQPLDTIAAITANGQTTVKSYYTIYDTLGNPVKGKIIETAPDQFSYNENLAGSRNNFLFVQYRDTLRKVDTGFNLIWKATLPPAMGTIFIPKNSNDIITTYTRAGVVYLAKMTDSAGVVSGKTYADWDNNGVYTATDSALSNTLISTNAAPATLSGNDSGKYYLYAAPGNYTLSANFNHPYYQFLPVTHPANISQFSDTLSGKDFRLRPLFSFTDVAVNFSSLNIARPGRQAYYTVSVKNFGASAQNIDVGLRLPAFTSYNSISGGAVTVNAPDTITIAMGNVNPFETIKATLYLDIAATATLHDTLGFYPVAYPYAADTIKTNNRDTLRQAIRTSFDPNEKEVNHTAQPLADTSNALLYTIHFQNTGTDTAFYVRIADTLSPKLDLQSFNFIDASHPVSTEIKHNVINFTFNPIALPDSNQNEPQSHGFVKFSIKPLMPFAVTDTVYNNAAIYFDYNNPVITNTAKSWYLTPAILPVTLQSFVADKRETTVLLRFETASEADLADFIIERSSDGMHFTAIGSVKAKGTISSGSSYSFEDLSPVQGTNFYRLKMVDKNLKTSYSWILAVKSSGSNLQHINVFPNPASDNLYLSLRSIGNPKTFVCTIADAGGKVIWAVTINTGLRDTYTINTSYLPNGIYFITASGNGTLYSEKFAVKH